MSAQIETLVQEEYNKFTELVRATPLLGGTGWETHILDGVLCPADDVHRLIGTWHSLVSSDRTLSPEAVARIDTSYLELAFAWHRLCATDRNNDLVPMRDIPMLA